MSRNTVRKVVIDLQDQKKDCESKTGMICGCRMGKKSFKCIGRKVCKALRFMSGGSKRSRKVSSSATLARSRSYVAEASLDSQRAEAIEDCIEFLNSNASLERSNSITSSC